MEVCLESVVSVQKLREFLYSFVSRGLAKEPDETFCAVASSSELLWAFEEFFNGDRANKACGMLSSMVDRPDAIEVLRLQFTRTLIGPDKLPASPWESSFDTKEHLVFQKTTLDVRGFFRSEGYVSAGYPHEPDDHIATELSFMAVLAGKTRAAFDAGNTVEGERLLRKQSRFIKDHLLRWIGLYAAGLEASSEGTEFYAQLVRLADWVVDRDACVLEECLNLRNRS